MKSLNDMNRSQGNSSPTDTELDWLAFRYIAGELSDEESASFESRLESDQQACEAVSRAVELAEVTALVAHRQLAMATPVRVAARSVWTRRLSWMACGAAACLLLVVAAQSVEPEQPKAGSSVAENLVGENSVGANSVADNSAASQFEGPSADSPELALAWMHARSTAPAVDLAEVTPGIGLPSIGLPNSGLDEPGFLDDAGMSEISTPSWMVVALEGLCVGPDVNEIQ